MAHARDPQWRATFGFDVFQIDQSLVASEPPNQITYLRGRFDQHEVTAALKKSGYQHVDIEGIGAYSLFPEAGIDLHSPVSQLAFTRMNNAVFLHDGTLAFSPTLDVIRQVVAVSNGEAPSLASRVDIPAVVQAIPDRLASAILILGHTLSLSSGLIDPRLSAEQAGALMAQIQQTGEMPPISLALLGVSPGGPLPPPLSGTPEPSPVAEVSRLAVFEIGLLTLTPDRARTAEQVVTARVQALSSSVSQRPYRDMFTRVKSVGPADQPIAVVQLTFGDAVSPRLWTQLLFRRDLLFLGW